MSRNGTRLLWGTNPRRNELDALIAAWPDAERWPFRSRWFHDFEGILREMFPQSSSADRRLTSRGAAPFYLKDGPNVP